VLIQFQSEKLLKYVFVRLFNDSKNVIQLIHRAKVDSPIHCPVISLGNLFHFAFGIYVINWAQMYLYLILANMNLSKISRGSKCYIKLGSLFLDVFINLQYS